MTAGSSRGRLALYDRAGIPAGTFPASALQDPNPEPLSDGALDDLGARGRALVLRLPPQTWKATLRVLVDEDPQPHIRDRGIRVPAPALLASPGGRLTADGVEFICSVGQPLRYSAAEPFALPAGDYEVEVLDLMSWKKEHRTAELERTTTRLERIVGRLVSVAMWTSVLVFPATLLVAPTVFVMARGSGGKRQGDAVLRTVTLITLAGLAVFVTIELASRRFPLLTRARDARRTFEDENPDLVVCLRRLRRP